jgi:predicted transposase YdaD
MLKHSEVKSEFRARHIQEASEKLRIMNLEEPQRKAYDEYMQNVSYQQSMLWSSREEGRDEGRAEGLRAGKEEGIAEGREEGKREEKIAIARTLLAQGVAPELVAASTGLSFEDMTAYSDAGRLPQRSAE